MPMSDFTECFFFNHNLFISSNEIGIVATKTKRRCTEVSLMKLKISDSSVIPFELAPCQAIEGGHADGFQSSKVC